MHLHIYTEDFGSGRFSSSERVAAEWIRYGLIANRDTNTKTSKKIVRIHNVRSENVGIFLKNLAVGLVRCEHSESSDETGNYGGRNRFWIIIHQIIKCFPKSESGRNIRK